MLIAVLKNKLIIFFIIFGTLSFTIALIENCSQFWRCGLIIQNSIEVEPTVGILVVAFPLEVAGASLRPKKLSPTSQKRTDLEK